MERGGGTPVEGRGGSPASPVGRGRGGLAGCRSGLACPRESVRRRAAGEAAGGSI